MISLKLSMELAIVSWLPTLNDPHDLMAYGCCSQRCSQRIVITISLHVTTRVEDQTSGFLEKIGVSTGFPSLPILVFGVKNSKDRDDINPHICYECSVKRGQYESAFR